MSRQGAFTTILLLLATGLALGGCALRSVPVTVDNCKAEVLRIRLQIGIDLDGTETLEHSGAFTKDFLDHKAGEPCQYLLSASFLNAEAFLARAGYRVERSGRRLAVSTFFGADPSAGSKALEEHRKLRDQVRQLSLSVLYAGIVLEHNADRLDEATQEMTWDLLPGNGREIRFVLEVP
jgi:hypothetical protein